MISEPDTTEAVAKHFLELDQDVFDPDDWPEGDERSLYKRIAEIATEADRKELAERGYVIVKRDLYDAVQVKLAAETADFRLGEDYDLFDELAETDTLQLRDLARDLAYENRQLRERLIACYMKQ